MANDQTATRASTGSSNNDANAQGKAVRLFHQTDLSRRWNISPRTLERWRWLGSGPRYLKLGGRIRYRIEDILAYEAEHMRQPGEEKSAAL